MRFWATPRRTREASADVAGGEHGSWGCLAHAVKELEVYDIHAVLSTSLRLRAEFTLWKPIKVTQLMDGCFSRSTDFINDTPSKAIPQPTFSTWHRAC